MAPSAPLSRQLIKQHLRFFQIERVKPSVNQPYGRIDEGRRHCRAAVAPWPCAGSDNPVFLKQRERRANIMRKAGIPEG
jgi:hypothetical protein